MRDGKVMKSGELGCGGVERLLGCYGVEKTQGGKEQTGGVAGLGRGSCQFAARSFRGPLRIRGD